MFIIKMGLEQPLHRKRKGREVSMERSFLKDGENFYPDTNGEISSSITQSWTEQALECYSIGCDCRRCSLSRGGYSFVCQMPRVIDALINLIGKPRIDMA